MGPTLTSHQSGVNLINGLGRQLWILFIDTLLGDQAAQSSYHCRASRQLQHCRLPGYRIQRQDTIQPTHVTGDLYLNKILLGRIYCYLMHIIRRDTQHTSKWRIRTRVFEMGCDGCPRWLGIGVVSSPGPRLNTTDTRYCWLTPSLTKQCKFYTITRRMNPEWKWILYIPSAKSILNHPLYRVDINAMRLLVGCNLP